MIDPKKLTVQDELSFANVKAHGPEVTERFLRMIENGESVRMAEMLATQKAPSAGITDQIYQRNRAPLLDQYHGSETVMEEARRNYRRLTGENMPVDAIPQRGLCRFPGDPRYTLTHKNTLADIKRHAEEDGRVVQGDWEHTPAPRPPKVQLTRMAPDLVEKYVNEYIAEDPSLLKYDRRELEEMVIDKHSRKITQNDLEPYGAHDSRSLAETLFARKLPPVVKTGGSAGKAGTKPERPKGKDRASGNAGLRVFNGAGP